MISTTKYFNCPICMTCKKEKNSTTCKKCKHTHICNICMLNMCEKGLADKCPICRQTEWRNQRMKKTSILPSHHVRNINSIRLVNNNGEVIGERNIPGCICYCTSNCKEICRCISGCISFFSIGWLLGFLLICSLAPGFNPNDPQETHFLIWFPFIIGIPCLSIFICWCGRCICKQKFERPVEDFVHLTCCPVN